MEELNRAFICIDFPEEVIKEIARIQKIVKTRKFTGKLTELENLHLTLKFLGENDSKTLEKVKERLARVEFSEMFLNLGEVGLFSHRSS